MLYTLHPLFTNMHHFSGVCNYFQNKPEKPGVLNEQIKKDTFEVCGLMFVLTWDEYILVENIHIKI